MFIVYLVPSHNPLGCEALGVGFLIAFSGLELAIAFIQAQVLQY